MIFSEMKINPVNNLKEDSNLMGLKEIKENYQRADLIKKIVNKINSLVADCTDEKINLMEVCGTHTVSIFRAGIRSLLPDKINLISGPGCPVCVTTDYVIDQAQKLAGENGVILATYGDMLKVPGSNSTLAEIKARGGKVKVIYSVTEALDLARKHPEREVVFLGIGFETTAPATAIAIKKAYQGKIDNFSVLVSHKRVIPVMEALLKDKRTQIDGFICPGHVSAIIGASAYEKISTEYGIPCVVAGFEPLDILETIWMLLKQIVLGEAKVENQYKRVVKEEGNSQILEGLYSVFTSGIEDWRGLGPIEDSGLKLKNEWIDFDAEDRFQLEIGNPVKSRCSCGDILKGIKAPLECLFYGNECKPEHPVGPCMVSSEGSCAVYYKYNVNIQEEKTWMKIY